MVPTKVLPARVNQHVSILRANRIKLDKFYLLYYLLNPNFKKLLLQLASDGATRNALTKSNLENLLIRAPKKIQEQKAIANVLTAFDDKIENMRAQNDTLEQTAQTIFTEWFGKYQLEDELPEGWRVGKLGETGDVICGKTPSKSRIDYYGNEIPFIKIPDMHNQVFVLNTNDNLSVIGGKSQKNKMIPANSICVSCIATVGLVSLTVIDSQTNQQINSIVPKNNYYREFLYLMLTKMKDYLNDLGSGGTATLNVNTSTFSNIEIIIPPEEVIKSFHKTQCPLFDKILSNLKQIQSLSQTRDTLLPKLMSGQLRVKEV